MATLKFRKQSPFLEEKQVPHPTDTAYIRYIKGLESPTSSGKSVVNLALFGLGRAGTIHLGNLLANSRCRVKYIIEASRKRAEEVRAHFRLQEDVKILSLEEQSIMLDDESVAGVIIAVPTDYHEELTLKSLAAGKAVFCEKPLSYDTKGIEKCYDLAEKNKLPLLCAMSRRFDAANVELKNRVHSGAVGQVHIFKTTSRDCPRSGIEYLRHSGGIVKDCGVHDIDLICWILGEYPETVFAMGSSFIPEIGAIPDYDTVNFTMKFPSGAIANTDLSRNAVYGYDQRIEVFGAGGMLVVNNSQPNNIIHSTVEGQSACPIFYSFASKYPAAFAEELDHFISLIEGTAEKPRVTRDEVIKVAAVCQAVAESLKQQIPLKVKY